MDPWYQNFKLCLTYWLLSANRNNMEENGHMIEEERRQRAHQNDVFSKERGQNKLDRTPSTSPAGTSNYNKMSSASLVNGNKVSSANFLNGEKLFSVPTLNGNNRILPSAFDFNGGKMSSAPDLNKNKLSAPNITLNGTLGSPPAEGIPDLFNPDRRHVCPHCYKGFKSRQQLTQHNLVHSNVRKYRCNFCERSFKQLSHLHQHHRIHTGEKPYRCPLDGCDRAFPQLSNLQHHIRNHDKLVDSQYLCVLCDRAYPNEATLKAHNTRVHLHSKPLDLTQQSPTSPSLPHIPVSSAAQQNVNGTQNNDNNNGGNSNDGSLNTNLNTTRQRKRKATHPQHLYMSPTMVPLGSGPLTPEEDKHDIIDPKIVDMTILSKIRKLQEEALNQQLASKAASEFYGMHKHSYQNGSSEDIPTKNDTGVREAANIWCSRFAKPYQTSSKNESYQNEKSDKLDNFMHASTIRYASNSNSTERSEASQLSIPSPVITGRRSNSYTWPLPSTDQSTNRVDNEVNGERSPRDLSSQQTHSFQAAQFSLEDFEDGMN